MEGLQGRRVKVLDAIPHGKDPQGRIEIDQWRLIKHDLLIRIINPFALRKAERLRAFRKQGVQRAFPRQQICEYRWFSRFNPPLVEQMDGAAAEPDVGTAMRLQIAAGQRDQNAFPASGSQLAELVR